MPTDEQRIIQGDCRAVLRTLPDESVQCIVTSPPYFGLRDYGAAEQIGLEQTPEQYVEEIVGVFREARRVLRHDGTLWLNLGDSYAAARGGTHQPAETLAGGEGGRTAEGERVNRGRRDGYNPTRNAAAIGLKHKDLIGIPWRVALALQADGWYLRQDIIWHKPNPMPESVTDRCTKAHEYVFLLSKSERYYFDHEAVQEPATGAIGAREVRNKRSVWTVATKPFPGAHFATFPPELVRPCVLAGSRPDDVVLDPFSGSGTTGEVALLAQRKYLGIEVNPVYVAMATERLQRIQEQPRLFTEATRAAPAGDER